MARSTSRFVSWIGGLALITLGAIALPTGCSERGGQSPDTSRAVISIPPLAGLVGPLLEAAGIESELIVPAGVSPHGYEAPPSKIAALRSSGVIVCIGLGMEGSLTSQIAAREKVAGVRVIRFADALGIDASGDGHDHDHAHGHDHTHDHDHEDGADAHDCPLCALGDGSDPHLWLSPAAARQLVTSAAVTLAGLHPDRLAAIEGAKTDLLTRIHDVDAAYRTTLEPHAGKSIIVAHNAYQRLADAYGLEVVPLTGVEGGEPTPGAIARAAALIREGATGVVYVEPQMDPSVGERLAESSGARVLMLDPLGDGDWFGLMERNLEALGEGLSAPAHSP